MIIISKYSSPLCLILKTGRSAPTKCNYMFMIDTCYMSLDTMQDVQSHSVLGSSMGTCDADYILAGGSMVKM